MKIIGIAALIIVGLTASAYRPILLLNGNPEKIHVRALGRANFEDSIQNLYRTIDLGKYGLSYEAFRYGMMGYYQLKLEGKLSNKPLLSFIDFTKTSTQKRFYTINLSTHRMVFHSLVSHGKNTGEDAATSFSNTPGSNQSSLGFYITAETYVGSKGYSMRLDGMDKGYNDKMRDRAIVMHTADYVSENWIKKYGRLGRSQGCPALPKNISRQVIDAIKEGTLIFAYYNDSQFLMASNHLKIDRLFDKFDVEEAGLANAQ